MYSISEKSDLYRNDRYAYAQHETWNFCDEEMLVLM
jgi:hypothetical protein